LHVVVIGNTAEQGSNCGAVWAVWAVGVMTSGIVGDSVDVHVSILAEAHYQRDDGVSRKPEREWDSGTQAISLEGKICVESVRQ
jgi:hypothetical protein